MKYFRKIPSILRRNMGRNIEFKKFYQIRIHLGRCKYLFDYCAELGKVNFEVPPK